ncbi:hypothetical protein CY35_18G084800 [Sphagnum magellanicum]|jgi:hypothetical protein|nr:hypothetical protein CY35_18G084800 [Sphagnum magellanicum]
MHTWDPTKYLCGQRVVGCPQPLCLQHTTADLPTLVVMKSHAHQHKPYPLVVGHVVILERRTLIVLTPILGMFGSLPSFVTTSLSFVASLWYFRCVLARLSFHLLTAKTS